jgi:hypothetical protein
MEIYGIRDRVGEGDAYCVVGEMEMEISEEIWRYGDKQCTVI